jgi:hypothetical protein
MPERPDAYLAALEVSIGFCLPHPRLECAVEDVCLRVVQ